MNKRLLACGLLTGALLCAGLTSAVAAENKEEQAKLEAQAKISRAQAEKTALAIVPDGTVKDAELEEENGKLIWSFDIATPGSQDITEVQVNAKTGEVESLAKETAADQAKEKSADAKEEKDEDGKK